MADQKDHFNASKDSESLLSNDCTDEKCTEYDVEKHPQTDAGSFTCEKSHSGPHICNVCGKALSTINGLKMHLRVHSDAKPYACSACEKRFKCRSNLKKHLNVHSYEIPFVCSLCNKGFSQMQGLKRHSESHTRISLGLNGDLLSPKKVVKPYFWDRLRKGFSKSYLKDRRQAVGKNK